MPVSGANDKHNKCYCMSVLAMIAVHLLDMDRFSCASFVGIERVVFLRLASSFVLPVGADMRIALQVTQTTVVEVDEYSVTPLTHRWNVSSSESVLFHICYSCQSECGILRYLLVVVDVVASVNRK